MKKRIVTIVICCILFISIAFVLAGCGKNKSALIGTWVSDWRPEMDFNVYCFKEDGTAKILVITRENINKSDKIEDMEESAEIVAEYKYKDNGDSFELTREGETEAIKTEYKIEKGKLKLTLDQAGYTSRDYEKIK